MRPDTVRIEVDGAVAVSGLLQLPSRASACYVMAHGAGAGMTHPFMANVANGLGERGVATLRYQFPYMERGATRVDGSALAHATVRAAVATAVRLAPGLPPFAGGKSFGGRMTSQAQAELPLHLVQGLVFFGFPLHPAGRPSIDRALHLEKVSIPMLFLQGSRDALAGTGLLNPLVARLGARATLRLVEGGDHSFHVPARSGWTDAQALGEALDAMVEWVMAPEPPSRGNATPPPARR